MNGRGWRIKQLLYDRDMTARELSLKLGITEATTSRYIHNNRTPNSDILAKMAAVLGTTMDYLETGKNLGADKWIPVAARLPEHDGLYLVTIATSSGKFGVDPIAIAQKMGVNPKTIRNHLKDMGAIE